MVAVLRVKLFSIAVFFASALQGARPDLVEQIRSLTEILAVQQVLTLHGVQSVGAVCVVNEMNQECWFYDVYLHEGELKYEYSAQVEALPDEARVECELCGTRFFPSLGYYEPGEYVYCSDCCHW